MALRIGIGLDDVLTNTTELFQSWNDILEVNADSYFHSKFIRNESFWGALKPFSDIKMAAQLIEQVGMELYVLTERPPSLLYITHSWLKRSGFTSIDLDHIVTQTIKRYDSKLLNLTVLCDSHPEVLKSFGPFDETLPIYINRNGIINEDIKTYSSLYEAVDGIRFL